MTSSRVFSEAQDTVSMACNHFPPLKIEHPVDGYIGADIEVLNSVLALASKKLVTTYFPWKRALLLAQKGDFDGLCSCSYTKDREVDFYFSDEIGRNSIGIYSINKTKKKGLVSLKGLTIGVVRGYNLETELRKVSIKTITGSSELNLLRMLEAKRIDAVYAYKTVVSELAKSNEFIRKFNYSEISSAPYYTCFSKKKSDSKGLLIKFNKSLKTIKENGDFEKIKRKYGL
tara:strand:+ start:865 stop:1554 length:690 start_codon:yes stop_codon:yes gene_type:complete